MSGGEGDKFPLGAQIITDRESSEDADDQKGRRANGHNGPSLKRARGFADLPGGIHGIKLRQDLTFDLIVIPGMTPLFNDKRLEHLFKFVFFHTVTALMQMFFHFGGVDLCGFLIHVIVQKP
jgi:hypothetical protein